MENTNTIQFGLASAGASMPAAGPSRDFPHFSPAMGRAAMLASIDNALADARDDAEAKRCIGREEWGGRQTRIRRNPCNSGERWPMTPYRPAMQRHATSRPMISAGARRSASADMMAASDQFRPVAMTKALERVMALRVITHNLTLLVTAT